MTRTNFAFIVNNHDLCHPVRAACLIQSLPAVFHVNPELDDPK
jgi:hypothetical protein